MKNKLYRPKAVNNYKKKYLWIFMIFYLAIFLFSSFTSARAEPPQGNLSDYIESERAKAEEIVENSTGENIGGAEAGSPKESDSENPPQPPQTADNLTLEEIYNNQFKASGAEKLWDKMPDETREIIKNLGMSDMSIDGAGAITEMKPDKIIDELIDLVVKNSGGPIKTFGALIGIIVIYAFMSALKETAQSSSVNRVYEVICSLTAAAVLIVPIIACIGKVRDATESTSVFMLSFVPVYTGIMITSGQAATALSYQTVVLFVTELVTLAATYFIVPFMTASLSLGLVGSMSPDYRIDKVGETINKICSWLIGLASTLFVGLLSLQGVVAGSADSLSNRAIRFSLGSFVPVVGGALGEALSSVQGCLNLLKTTVGGIGVIVNALIVLPPIIECAMWLVVLSLCTSLTEMFQLGSLTSIFRVVQSVIKTLVAVLACCALFMIIATTIVTKAGGGMLA